jgi:hypothetical protein
MKFHFKLMTTSIITTAKFEHYMNTESMEMTKIRNVVQITARPYDRTYIFWRTTHFWKYLCVRIISHGWQWTQRCDFSCFPTKWSPPMFNLQVHQGMNTWFPNGSVGRYANNLAFKKSRYYTIWFFHVQTKALFMLRKSMIRKHLQRRMTMNTPEETSHRTCFTVPGPKLNTYWIFADL